jgi:hypothetical protein
MLLSKWFRMILPPSNAQRDFTGELALLTSLCILFSGCGSRPSGSGPTIEFTVIPPAAPGGPEKLAPISGRVIGARPGQRIVLFAKDGGWWVQPLVDKPFTDIQANSQWTNSTHLGTEYAALLVDPAYQPPATIAVLPGEGGSVIAVKTVAGAGRPAARTLRFSGYEWEVRDVPSSRGGNNTYDAANAQTDANGLLHLRISQRSGQWICAEVKLTRSLGYGSYVFVVRDTPHLDPAVVASMFTWDDQGVDPNHREMSIELTRWGDAANKNAQYVVQPYYVPANVDRFMAPAGVLTHSFRWEPGRVTFRSVRGAANVGGSPVVAEHVFNSGVPSPGGESVHLNLYIFGSAESALQNEAEVVIEKFQYLP